MKFEIDTGKVYESLRGADDFTPSPRDELAIELMKQLKRGEEWRGDNEIIRKQIKTARYFYGDRVKLPTPFDHASLNASRNGDGLSGQISIYSPLKTTLSEFNFDGLSKRMASVFEENWYPADNKGRGYILDSGTPRIVIGGEDPDYTSAHVYRISIGQGGADARCFGSEEQFIRDMCELQMVAGVFLNQGLELARNKMGITLPPKNFVIRLS